MGWGCLCVIIDVYVNVNKILPMTPHGPAPHDPLYQRVAASLARQGMMQPWGVALLSVAPGTVVLSLPYSERVTQQQGGFHGGAMGALADIAGGYAALTMAPPGMEVVTVEYKINFLAAFQNGVLEATGRVIRAGKRLTVTTADVVHVAPDGARNLAAVMQQTLVPVAQTY
jgi:uncharacterized protein (TIGR00369 family)